MESKIVDITDLSIEGEGIAHLGNVPVFIPFAIEGERVEINNIKEEKCVSRATICQMIKQSPRRKMAECPYFMQCGGCQVMHMNYETQLLFKRLKVKRLFDRYEIKANIEPCIKSEEFGFRNSIQLKLEIVNGELNIGFYMPKSHDLINIKECKLCGEWSQKLIKALHNYYENMSAPIEFNISNLHAIYVKESDTILVVAQSLNGQIVEAQKLYDCLNSFLNVGLWVGTAYPSNTMLNRKTCKHLMGVENVEIKILNKIVHFSALNFLQTNEFVFKKILNDICESMFEKRLNLVYDLYSGIGITSLLFAGNVDKVISIEQNTYSCDFCKKNLILNNIDNVEVIAGDCANVLPSLVNSNNNVKNGTLNADLCKKAVFVDPPRGGLSDKVVDAIIAIGADYIYYMSCNPKTMAKDFVKLTESYEIIKAQPYDMFANQEKVEVVVELKKIN